MNILIRYMFVSIFVIASNSIAISKPIRLQVEMKPSALSRSEIFAAAGASKEGIIEESLLPKACEAIIAELVRRGYPLAVFDSVVIKEDLPERLAVMFISAGQELSMTGANGAPQRITSDLLELGASTILDSLTDAGFPFSTVTFRPDRPLSATDSLQIDLTTDVKPGSFLRIGKITFTGGKSLGDNYLTLESRLKTGSPFSRTDLKRSVERLQRLPALSSVGEPLLRELSPGILELIFPVSTKSSTRFSGIAAIAPGAEKPTGEFSLEIGNLFGGGRSASFAWMGLNPEREGIKGSYREGWVGGLPLALKGELESWRMKGSHSRTTLGFGLEWEPLGDLVLGLTGASERTVALVEEFAPINATTNWLKTAAVISRLDSRWNPSRGYAIRVENGEGRRKYSGDKAAVRINTMKTSFETALTIPGGASSPERTSMFAVGKLFANTHKWVGYLRVENQSASGQWLLIDELPRFGGHSSVRGYLEDSHIGRNVLFGAIELRYRPNLQAGYFGVTGDWGWIAEPQPGIHLDKRLVTSFGITTTFPTNIGTISLDLALPAGKSFDQARLHLTLAGWL